MSTWTDEYDKDKAEAEYQRAVRLQNAPVITPSPATQSPVTRQELQALTERVEGLTLILKTTLDAVVAGRTEMLHLKDIVDSLSEESTW